MTPHTSHVPLLSTEQSTTCFMTPLILDVSATATGWRTLDGTEQGVDAEIRIENAQASFHGYSCVTNTGTLETTFLVDDNLVPIKIEKILGIYTLFNLLFVI